MSEIIRSIPPLPQTERGTFCCLNADKPAERLLYCNGSNVIWRAIAPLQSGAEEKVDDVFCWRGHVKRVNCAAMSPSCQWVVSGDIGGAIRVWGAKGEHIQKNEYVLWNGAVKDVAFSGDSTRIVAAGDGKERSAVAIVWDTGSKTGEVAGHSKAVNSISFRSERPFRIVTGSEDMIVAFHQGPPFKFLKSQEAHTNFVNRVRFSPDGEWAFSAGSDSKLVLYTGKEGDIVKEFEKPTGISGTLWAAEWSPDSARIATAGGDKKVRVWDREKGVQLSEYKVGSAALEDMQLGLSWPSQDTIITVCLDGRLLFWKVAADGQLELSSALDGTQGPLSCIGCDVASGKFVYGGTDGYAAITAPDKKTSKLKVGKTLQHVLMHTTSYAGDGEAWFSALDDCVRRVSLETGELLGAIEVKEFMVGLAWLDAAETKAIVATGKSNLHCLGQNGVEWTKSGALPRRPTAMAFFPGTPGRLAVALDRPEEVVAGVRSQQFDIHLFDVADVASPDSITQTAVLEGHVGEVSALRFSPSGEFLASSDALNKIKVWNLSSGTPTLQVPEWGFHTSRVNCLEWLPGGKRLVSGALDRAVYVWNVDSPGKRVHIPDVHKGGVAGIAACGEDTFASVGQDGFILVHKLT